MNASALKNKKIMCTNAESTSAPLASVPAELTNQTNQVCYCDALPMLFNMGKQGKLYST
jgi:hypothetical protein